MESLSEVLEFIFREHFVSLIFLSFSWLLIYGVVSLSDLLARKILLRAPFYIWIQLNRRKLGLPDWRNAIASGDRELADVSPNLAAEVGKLYGSVDDKISRIRSGQHWVAKLLSDESIYNEIINIVDNEWSLLESDSALCEAASSDPKASRIGLLSSVGNHNVSKNEVLGVLFHSLKFGPSPDVKKYALFHIQPTITSSEQLEKLESIVHTLPASLSQMAEKTVKEIRNRLSFTEIHRTPQAS